MILRIAGKAFNTESIVDIIISDNQVLIQTHEDFHRIRYTNEEEIIEAKNWLKFHSLTKKDLLEAIHILMITCDFFINTKEQCELCPLSKKDGCVFTSIPIDWR